MLLFFLLFVGETIDFIIIFVYSRSQLKKIQTNQTVKNHRKADQIFTTTDIEKKIKIAAATAAEK